MSNQPGKEMNLPLLSLPLMAVMLAQFLSALADNALLFAAIALVKSRGFGAEYVPLLQEFFVAAFIVLAPFVGPLADALPKGRVMLLANGMKFVGAGAMYAGLHPLAAYGLVGVGAAAYSPAKYGILSELVGPNRLVQANSMLEGSTIVAILLGVVAGGWLADQSVSLALLCVIGCYLAAAGVNLLIPRLPAAHPLETFNPAGLVADFVRALKMLYRNPDARFSMLGTSLFWGSGSTLRLLLVAWVPVALGVAGNGTPAMLNGVVAVGIALGAAVAGRFITLQTVDRALPAGLLLGLLVIVLATLDNQQAVMAVLVGVGVCGGVFVVPLNALLQERGHESVGSGHAIAVQNFSENLAMLGLVGLYTLAVGMNLPIVDIAAGFGGLILAGMALIAVMRRPRLVPAIEAD